MKSLKTKKTPLKILVTLLFVFLSILILIPFWAIFVGTFQEGSMLIRNGLNLKLDFSTANLDN